VTRNPFKRSVDVPADVLTTAPLEKGEKVLAGTVAQDGSWLLGTRDALLITGAARVTGDRGTRIPWQHIERVTASVVLQRHVAVSGKNGLFVIARRAPRGDSEITWSYEFDRGIDPDDPAVMVAARRGLDTAAEELGL